MRAATPEMAVQHPIWSMGAKISVDSATMMNKGLELIEAARLFPVPEARIEVLVHPQSTVHGMVAVCRRLGAGPARHARHADADRALPGLAGPDAGDAAAAGPGQRWAGWNSSPPDPVRFPALRLAREALQAGGGAPTILNAANEVAVALFLDSPARLPRHRRGGGGDAVAVRRTRRGGAGRGARPRRRGAGRGGADRRPPRRRLTRIRA